MSRRFPMWALLFAALHPLIVVTGSSAALLIYFLIVPAVLPVLIVANIPRPIDDRVSRYFLFCILSYSILVSVFLLLPEPPWLMLTLWGTLAATTFLTITRLTVLPSLRWPAVWSGGLMGALLGTGEVGQLIPGVALWNLSVTFACYWGDSPRSVVEREVE